MAWTAPRTWITGETLAASLLNTHLRDELLFLYGLVSDLAYNEFTSNVTVSATAEASANTVVTASAVTTDGVSPIWVEFGTPRIDTPAVAAGSTLTAIFDGSTSLGLLGNPTTPAAAIAGQPITRRRRLVLSAASHTLSIRAWVAPSGTGTVVGGAGGTGANMPGYILVRGA